MMRRLLFIMSLLLCMGVAHAQSSDSAIVEVLRKNDIHFTDNNIVTLFYNRAV